MSITGYSGRVSLLSNISVALFLVIFSSCVALNQISANTKQYDVLTKIWVYEYVETPPLYNGSAQGFMIAFNKNFWFSGNRDDKIPTKLNLQFVVDKKGNLIGTRIRGKRKEELTELEQSAVAFTETCQNWQPGIKNGKPVNVLVTMPIIVDYR